MKYYTINENAARAAKNMNSFSDYIAGSATAEYKRMVNEAYRIAEIKQSNPDLTDDERSKIEYLVDKYAKKLAENINNRNAIDARVPSMLITGGGNFPVHAKKKQNAARDKNYSEYKEIQNILEKIKSIGTGGIKASDSAAIEKLEKKIQLLTESQEKMKSVNAYYRKHKTLDGCTELDSETIEQLKDSMASSWRPSPAPFESYTLSNNNANIRRYKSRLESLKRAKEKETTESTATNENGSEICKVVENTENMRIQLIFDGKPSDEVRAILKNHGFRWAPSQKAWQRQLTENGKYMTKKVLEELKKIS